ncbi:hypothetical protein WA158_002628 [Blastocystis sp. Blastoise]
MGDGVGSCGQFFPRSSDTLLLRHTNGSERMASVLQGVCSNFDTDVFYSMKDNLLLIRQPYIKTDKKHVLNLKSSRQALPAPFQTVSALIYQGVYPSPTGRGCILRKLIRRCLKYEYIYNIQFPFLSSCIPAVIQSLELFYPDISSHVQDITSIVENEEMHFWWAFECGKDKLEELKRSIPPSLVDLNQLYGSTGIPLDLSLVLLEKRGIVLQNTNIPEDEIDQSKNKDNKSKRTNIGLDSYVIPILSVLPSFHTFNGYTIHYNNNNKYKYNLPPLLSTQSTSSIQAILNPPRGNKAKYSYVCIDPCPFFPTGGGQLGDQGTLLTDDGNTIPIIDTIRVNDHFILLKASISVPASLLHARVNPSTSIHHTSTHLLHELLRRYINDPYLINPLSPQFPLTSPLQAGSHVDPSIMRLDYSLKGDQNSLSQVLKNVEKIKNIITKQSNPVHYDYMSYTNSISRGYNGIFADNYKETVRGVEVEGIRTHCENIKDIYPFITLKNSSISAGIKRVEVVTGPKAVDYLYNEHISLKHCNNKEVHVYIIPSEFSSECYRKRSQFKIY